MNTKIETNMDQRLRPWLPLIADGAALLALLFWLPSLAARLQTPSGWNALLLVVCYLLFCTGVYLSRKLLPAPPGRWPPPAWLVDRRLRATSGVLFALLMATTLAYQLGFFTAIMDVGAGLLEEGSTAALFVYAPGAWLAFSALVIMVLAFPVDSNVPPASQRYGWLALLALLFTDVMLVFTAAQALAAFGGLDLPRGLWPTAAVLLALLVSFLPARALYQSRQPTLPGWLSFAVVLLTAALLATTV